MDKASVDNSLLTVTAQGSCVARALEQPAEAEGLSVVSGAVNETVRTHRRRLPYGSVSAGTCHSILHSTRYNAALVVPNSRLQNLKLDQTKKSESSPLTAYIREKVREAGVKAGVQIDGQRDVTSIYADVFGGVEKSKSVVGSNLPRLRALKKKYDPVWDKWYPITPA